jgi:hypothetical protein
MAKRIEARLESGETVLSAADANTLGREALVALASAGFIEIEDTHGNRVTVTEAHWRRWKAALSKTFRPVAETPDTSVSIEPPTGDKTEEN